MRGEVLFGSLVWSLSQCGKPLRGLTGLDFRTSLAQAPSGLGAIRVGSGPDQGPWPQQNLWSVSWTFQVPPRTRHAPPHEGARSGRGQYKPRRAKAQICSDQVKEYAQCL